MKKISEIVTLESKRGSRGREGGVTSEREIMRIAVHLADSLGDWKSLAFFRKVARLVPESRIQEALRSTLDLKPTEIEVSRGAYFNALMRPYLPPKNETA